MRVCKKFLHKSLEELRKRRKTREVGSKTAWLQALGKIYEFNGTLKI